MASLRRLERDEDINGSRDCVLRSDLTGEHLRIAFAPALSTGAEAISVDVSALEASDRAELCRHLKDVLGDLLHEAT